jgi:hypothetical protein
MNEQLPEAAPVEPISMPYKDRSAGLTVFGILTIFLGCMAGLLILLMLAGQAAAAARTSNASVPFSTLLPVIAIYGILAVALVWLGIGSIMARRWARALLLIFSWSWLVMGFLVVIVMAVFIPKILANMPASGTPGQPAMPPAAMGVVMVVIFVVFGVIFVILPAVWTFFYNSPHVKATCGRVRTRRCRRALP